MSSKTSKKRKTAHNSNGLAQDDTTKPSAVFKPHGSGRSWTLSLALPGSIIANAQTHDQKTNLAGQIARACAVFCVDEIVVFDDGQTAARQPEEGGYTAFADPNYFLYHLLSYLETPPHMRRTLFPMHPDLRTAGALPSLDMPHHLKTHEWCPFREGVAERQLGNETKINCGLDNEVVVPVAILEHSRVTLQLPEEPPTAARQRISATAVDPAVPRESAGYYWGYTVRQASTLGAIFTESPFDGGYDMSIGTSERGATVDTLFQQGGQGCISPVWNHLIIVLGGVAGLEVALQADHDLRGAGVSQVQDLFDRWINLVPGQGSRTIRTEEALWIAMSRLRPLVEMRG
ncbi:hypothetical protein AMS68_004734 [Peltaster fructicola]|uniref:DUF171-domain-containing protein n=1 Tax=Peltaster fructicola TaxID=286661 RepID=A0A6H0XWS3_9PEZI|nr:hypothetical protein AMS68_004734 [Peltaster fructicola]